MLHQITKAQVDAASRLQLHFADGSTGSIDLSGLVALGGVFDALRNPNILKQVRIGSGGRYLEWPGEIDLCADALWERINKKPALTTS